MPLLTIQELPNGAMFGVWEITETDTILASMIKLNDADNQKLASFQREKRRCEWLAVRVLTETLVGSYSPIGYKENGAPYLINQNFHISLSHTNGYAAVAINPNKSIGIDIEYPSERILKITDRFLSANELSFIPINQSVAYQTICWCIKEALYKYWGQPNVIFNTDLEIKPFTILPQPLFNIEATIGKNNKEPISVSVFHTDSFTLAVTT